MAKRLELQTESQSLGLMKPHFRSKSPVARELINMRSGGVFPMEDNIYTFLQWCMEVGNAHGIYTGKLEIDPDE
jgi:hypothetical protein